MDTPDFQDIGLTLSADESAAGLKLKRRDLDISASKKKEFDFQDEVARMLDAAKQQRQEKGSGIKLDEIGSTVGLLDAETRAAGARCPTRFPPRNSRLYSRIWPHTWRGICRGGESGDSSSASRGIQGRFLKS